MRDFAITVLRSRKEQTPNELRPASHANVEADDLRGAICAQWKRCDRANCRCAQGELHGPYYYRFYREDGRLKKQYLSTKCLDNLHLIQEALADREMRIEYRQYRQQNAQYKAEAREARLLLKEMGEGARFGERTLAQAKEVRRRKRLQQSQDRARRAKK